MLKRLSRNTLILLLSNVGTAVLAFLLTILVGRGLGEVALGQYAAVMAWIFPLTILADFGIGTLITRDLAQDRQLTHHYVRQALEWRWVLGTGLVVFVWGAAPYLSSDAEIVAGLRITSGMIWIDSVFGIYTAVWRAWENMWPILVLNVGLLTLQVIGTIFVLWQQPGIIGVFVVLVIADALQLIAAWGLWRWKFYAAVPSKTAISKNPALQFLQKSIPFAIGGFFATLYVRLLFLLLEILTTSSMVGWFAAASRFTEAAKMPVLALFGALFPMFAALSTDSHQLRLFLRRINLGISFYGLASALIFTFLGSFILNVTFGEKFQSSVPILIVLAWSLIPTYIRQNLAAVHYALQQEKRVNLFLLAILPIQLGLGIVLIRQWGGIGAAWTLLCTESLLMLWLGWSYRGYVHANRDSDTGIFRQ